jgi:hypothetical protein
MFFFYHEANPKYLNLFCKLFHDCVVFTILVSKLCCMLEFVIFTCTSGRFTQTGWNLMTIICTPLAIIHTSAEIRNACFQIGNMSGNYYSVRSSRKILFANQTISVNSSELEYINFPGSLLSAIKSTHSLEVISLSPIIVCLKLITI